MAKKLADIEKIINNSNLPFFEYLGSRIPFVVFSKLLEISQQTRVFIFSGIIRNYFLKRNEIRDLDIVLESRVDIESIFSEFSIRKNSFGGYKIADNNISLDLWYLDDTWAFKYQKVFNFSLELYIPYTAFFNFSAVMYSFNEKRFYYTVHFLRFLRDKQMNVVYKPNANHDLCIINSFYYADKYELKISENLRKYLLYLFKKSSKDYQRIQIKHFGKVLYRNSDIEERINELLKTD